MQRSCKKSWFCAHLWCGRCDQREPSADILTRPPFGAPGCRALIKMLGGGGDCGGGRARASMRFRRETSSGGVANPFIHEPPSHWEKNGRGVDDRLHSRCDGGAQGGLVGGWRSSTWCGGGADRILRFALGAQWAWKICVARNELCSVFCWLRLISWCARRFFIHVGVWRVKGQFRCNLLVVWN